MLFDQGKGFGYPVLRPFCNDYVPGPQFQPKVTPKENEDGNRIIFSCDFAVSVKEIKELISSEKAAYCVVVDCRDTFVRKAITSFNGQFSFEEEQSKLHGTVIIEKYIIATSRIESFTCESFHQYFQNKNILLDPGMIIAQAIPEEYQAFNEMLSNLGSPLSKQVDESLKDGEWFFEVAGDTVSVFANSNQLVQFNNYDKPTMANLMLVPVVEEMVKLLQDPSKYEDLNEYGWARKIMKTLEELNLGLDSFDGNSLRICHHILGFPVRMGNNKFSVDEVSDET